MGSTIGVAVRKRQTRSIAPGLKDADRARVGDLAAEQASRTFAGRKQELAILSETLHESGPSVVYLHGIAGIGKSRLITAFAEKARISNAIVAVLDCRAVEPTQTGFLRALGGRFGRMFHSPEDALKGLSSLGTRVILALDQYEVLRLLDTWLRQDFIPRLPSTVRMILGDREAPSPAWNTAPGWQRILRVLELNQLPTSDAARLLSFLGVPEELAARINRVAQGHPLALTLAASFAANREEPAFDEVAIHSVIQELTRLYVRDIADPITRQALEAACVLRRITISLLRSMLPGVSVQDAFSSLSSLPFVQFGLDGLHIHDSVKQVLATALRASDPSAYRRYQRAAWSQLRAELAAASSVDLWRYTADMLYLLENPVIREAFFPSGGPAFIVEPARAQDGDAVCRLCERHEGVDSVRALRSWWAAKPDTFSVVKDRTGCVKGFYCLRAAENVSSLVQQNDPVLRRWLEHLRDHPLAQNEKAIFLRRWLSEDEGESPSAVQAACWLDIKRIYVALRPKLRRVYLALRDLSPYAQVAQRLGFVPIPSIDESVDGATYHTAMLDFGPGSVDGWLTRLVAAELGVISTEILDEDARELVIDQSRIPLTRLEFEVFRYLREREGKATGREDLIRDVWAQRVDVGSNVVDAVIKSLRKKLGENSKMIETVGGHGYRLKSSDRSGSY